MAEAKVRFRSLMREKSAQVEAEKRFFSGSELEKNSAGKTTGGKKEAIFHEAAYSGTICVHMGRVRRRRSVSFDMEAQDQDQDHQSPRGHQNSSGDFRNNHKLVLKNVRRIRKVPVVRAGMGTGAPQDPNTPLSVRRSVSVIFTGQ